MSAIVAAWRKPGPADLVLACKHMADGVIVAIRAVIGETFRGPGPQPSFLAACFACEREAGSMARVRYVKRCYLTRTRILKT